MLSGLDDVRTILPSYKGKDIPTAFAEQQKRIRADYEDYMKKKQPAQTTRRAGLFSRLLGGGALQQQQQQPLSPFDIQEQQLKELRAQVGFFLSQSHSLFAKGPKVTCLFPLLLLFVVPRGSGKLLQTSRRSPQKAARGVPAPNGRNEEQEDELGRLVLAAGWWTAAAARAAAWSVREMRAEKGWKM